MESVNKFGRYEIKSVLGHGGMATVYLAYDPRFGRNVALKVMSVVFRDDPAFRGRFEREARTIATLEHPAIVPVYDFGEDHDQLYLVMRYMPGGSLADRIIRKPLSLEEALPIIRRIGDALDHAHSQGVIHRDLKPGNILFDQYGNPFLSDFGIVKLAEATSSITGSGVIGTPAYMSPEQIHGDKELDGRSDIYTLGIILFEMLTGRKPYRADTPVKQMMAHILNPIPSIHEVKPELPPAFDSIIQKALSKQREERYSSAGEMTAELATTIAGITHRPPLPSPPAKSPPPQAPAEADHVVRAAALPPLDLEADNGETATMTAVLGMEAPAAETPAGAQTTAEVAQAAPEGEEDDYSASGSPPAAPAASAGRGKWGGRLVAGLLGLLLLASLFTFLPSLIEAENTPTPEQQLAGTGEEPTPTTEPTSTQTPAPTQTIPATRSADTPLPPPPSPTPTAETIVIGRSVEEAPIEAVQFGDGPIQVILVGGLHAGFSPSSVVLARQAIDHFSQNPEEIPEEVTLTIIPSASPDSPLDPGQLPGRLNANAVDLNRNWGCRWQKNASWRGQLIQDMGGAEPFSEPETQSLRDFIVGQEPVAVVFWEAMDPEGLVSPGSCGETPTVSQPLAELYGEASGYDVANYEETTRQIVTGDSTNWLDDQGIPAISVLLPDYEVSDWEPNLAGIRAILEMAAGQS